MSDLSGPILLDLTAISDEPVAIGWHRVTIEQAEPKLSNQQKIPSLFILARVSDEEDPDFNSTVLWNVMMEGDGLIFTKRFFKALELPTKLEYDSLAALGADLIGREVEVKIKHRMYQGEKRANVGQWRTPSLEIDL